MKSYCLESISLEEAKEKQFSLVDTITEVFEGDQFLQLGELGVCSPYNEPLTTYKVEEVLAKYFHAEKAALVSGAGTGAIRWSILALCKSNDTILVHKAPIYPTTKATVESMNLNVVYADFNNITELNKVLNTTEITAALVQYTRQQPQDCYDYKAIIEIINAKHIPVITDDNYAVMKVKGIGVEYGAAVSCFSSFKLLGPENVGVVIGSAVVIDYIKKMNYSGGSKIQGHQAMEALRGLVYAPVSLAIQAEENEKLVNILNSNLIREVKQAFLANAQSKVLLVEFNKPIAKQVLEEAQKLGAASHPVGAESKYEIVPMFYRISGTFIQADPALKDRMIRINPMRAGADTVLRILKKSIERVR